jgi:hypothetical protein
MTPKAISAALDATSKRRIKRMLKNLLAEASGTA